MSHQIQPLRAHIAPILLGPPLRPRTFASEADYFPDRPPLASNATFHLYAYSRGLDGVDQDSNYLFVHVLVISLFVAAFGFLILRIAKMARAYVRLLVTVGASPNQRFWATNHSTWWPSFKKHIEYAPIWSVRHNREIQISQAVSIGTLPSRFQLFFLASYLSCNIAYCLVLPWHAADSQSVIAALRGRAGVMAAINLIPLVVFACRNNPLIQLLNISYDTYNLLHRWVGRTVLLLTLVHTCCWLSNTLDAGGPQAVQEALLQVPSYKWAMVGTCLMTTMVVIAWSPLRHAFYETFLMLHRVLALIAFIGIYLHIRLHQLPQLFWIQLVFIFWGAEWFFRLVPWLYYNVGPSRVSRVTVEAMPSQACRVTVDLARAWKPRPGCHAHLWIPSIAPLSTHPFSIAWTSNSAALAPPLSAGDVEKGEQDEQMASPAYADATSVSFIVRACTGFTRQLYDRAEASKSRTFTGWGFIEWPYGSHFPLDSYGTVVLFAAGVGITHQVSFVRHLVTGHANGTVSCRRIVLVWSVPNPEALEWVRPWMDEILRIPGRRECLNIKLFITKPRNPQELQSSTGTVQMYPGRCNPRTIIEAEMKDQAGAMAVTACGNGPFSDGVRNAVRCTVQDGSVDYFEEAFTY